jgi:hypothetical protein
LRGLEFLSELDGKTFRTLPQSYKVLIEDDTQLIFNNLLPETPARAKFTIFSRVNTGGMQLNAQEIRHALFQGPITRLLKTLSCADKFLTATDRAIESRRMGDREVILRTLAFAQYGTKNYRRYDDLNSFLIDAMQRFNTEVSEAELAALGARFLSSVETIRTIFGRYAFRKFSGAGSRRGPVNKALFEALTSAVMQVPDRACLLERRDRLFDGLIKLLKTDTDFISSVTYGTGKTIAVQTRFQTIERLIDEVIK